MSNLIAALNTSAGALQVFQEALTVTQNNVANASTPGYARQVQSLQALPLNSSEGLTGGVAAGPVEDARDQFAERNVQQQATALGTWTGQANILSAVQGAFDVSGKTGVPAALSSLYSSFSTWASAPNDQTARQGVLDAAQSVASAFGAAARSLSGAVGLANTGISDVVTQVNQLTAQLRDNNMALGRGEGSNTALQASNYSTLEKLSQLVPVTAFQAKDGTTTVLLNGQTALVAGQEQYSLQANITDAGATVQDAAGHDLTGEISGGQLAGILTVRNGVLAQLAGGGTQQGDINQLAQAVADRVNGLLQSGTSSDGPPPVAGVPVFTYDASNPTTIAQTMAVDPSVTPDQLAANDPGPPAVSNGIAIRLANLEAPQSPADMVGGLSYAQFFGRMAGAVGQIVSTAQTNAAQQQDLMTQAQDLRQQSSGVSLNQEAVTVMEFQRAYQAASKVVTVLDGLLQSTIDMLR